MNGVNDDIVLQVEDLTVYYELEEETVKAVNHISFSLKRGETIGLVGETGAGKTTTALALLRLVPDPPGVIKKRQDYCLRQRHAVPAGAKAGIDSRQRHLDDFPGSDDQPEPGFQSR